MSTHTSIHSCRPADDQRYAILRDVAYAIRNADSDITSIEAVIAATEVTSQNIASKFGDTSGLIIALAEMVAMSMLQPLEDCTTEAGFRKSLLEFGSRVTDEYSGPQLKRLHRIALTDVIRNTGVGRDFYKHGPGLVQNELARFFRSAQAAGIVLSDDSHRLASHLMALLRAGWDLSGTAPQDVPNPSPHDDVDLIIERFCAGIQNGVER